MGFAAPLFLIGLMALVIPFLLLFTKASSSRITQFSSVEFLRTITEHASRTMEWKRLLLLAVRVLAILSLAAAFALPFTSRSCRLSLWGAGPAKNVVIFLDNSLSMSAAEKNSSLLGQARRRAEAVVRENADRGAAFSVYTFQKKVRPLMTDEEDVSKVLAGLGEVEVSEASSDFGLLIQFLTRQFGQKPALPEEIWVFSDFSMPSDGPMKLMEDYQRQTDPLRTLHWVPVRPTGFQNFWPREMVLPPRPFLRQARENLTVLFDSRGYEPGTEVKLDLWVENMKTASRTAVITESGKGSVTFEHTFPAGGRYPIRIESPEDSLVRDNRLHAIAEVGQPLELLVVEDSVYEYPFQNPYYYVSQALESFGGVAGRDSWVDMARIPSVSLRDLQLDDYDVIMVADNTKLEVRDLAQLRAYLEGGGSVIFALGPAFSERNGGDALAHFLGGKLGAPKTAERETQSFSLSGIDYRHRLLGVFEEGRQGDLSRVPFRSFVPFTQEADKAGEVILWFESRWPALIEKREGAGKLFLWTSSLNQEWTSFPKDPLYVPFIFELLKYAAFGASVSDAQLHPGDNLVFDSGREAPAFEQVMVRSPKGEQVTLFGKSGAAPPPYALETAGVFEWVGVRGKEMVRQLAVCNTDAAESAPFYAALETLGVNDSKAGEEDNRAPESSQRRFFYRPFFYFLAGLLLLEAWLANRFYKPQWV